MPTPTTTDRHAAIAKLTMELVRVVADSPCDPIGKPLAILLAAERVCCLAAPGSEQMRLQIATAVVSLMRSVAPEFVAAMPRDPSRGH